MTEIIFKAPCIGMYSAFVENGLLKVKRKGGFNSDIAIQLDKLGASMMKAACEQYLMNLEEKDE